MPLLYHKGFARPYSIWGLMRTTSSASNTRYGIMLRALATYITMLSACYCLIGEHWV